MAKNIDCEACSNTLLVLQKIEEGTLICPICGSKYKIDSNNTVISKELIEPDIAAKLKENHKQYSNEQLVFYLECLGKYPDNPILSLKVARCYRLLKEYNNAIEYYNKIIETYPAFEYPHCELGRLYLERKEFAKAKIHFEKGLSTIDAYENVDSNAEYYVAYAKALSELGEKEKSSNILKYLKNNKVGTETIFELMELYDLKPPKNIISKIKFLIS